MTDGFLEGVAHAVGYRWSDQSRLLVERALDRAASVLGVSREEAAVQVRSRTPKAWRAFADAVAIHETYFFRHPEHFALVEAFARDRAMEGRPVAHAWSVGCSTGEELWSLALTLWPHAPSLRVAGSDLSNEAITFAQKGRYADRSFRDGDWRRHPGLAPCTGGFEIVERIRERALFGVLNLAGDPVRPPPGMPGELDVIFCRNVLVYLKPEVCTKVVAQLAEALSDGGVLIVGAVEVPVDVPDALEPIDSHIPGAFRKIDPLSRGERARVPAGRPAKPARTTEATASPPPPRPTGTETWARNAVESLRQLANDGRLDEALAAAESLKDLPGAMYLAASIHLERGDLARATAALQQMLRARPDSVPAHLQLALVAHRRGDARAVERHRSNVQRLLMRYRDEDDLGVDGMKAAWARQVLSTLGAEAES